MKRVILLTATVSMVLGFGAGYFFAIVSWTRTLMSEVMESHADLHIGCFAKKYSWHFHYAGADGEFGKTDLSLVTAENPIGLNVQDPRSQDDIVSPELVLPCGARVELILNSSDVIHSLGEFHEKMAIDAVPGVKQQEIFQTPAAPTAGTLRCVQLCGPGFKDHHAPYRYIDAAAFATRLKAQPPFIQRPSKD
ncbi:hypothetical protein [Prosthecobacter sp.]|uniref:hypothetical protein n=1 Tax=Prosthecobacter sp. TaxID=1965333 RepID=UPI00378392E4